MEQETPLIVVDEDDQVLSYQPRSVCHQGEGILHRGISVILYRSDGKMLIQRRSKEKLLWPLHWSNACCTHPKPGECYQEAAQRRTIASVLNNLVIRMKYAFKSG